MRALAGLFLVVLTACTDSEDEHAGLDIPEGLTEFREIALDCRNDVQWTYFERSEHCVIVAETMFEYLRDDCDGERSYDCANWNYVHTEAIGIYQRAIVESLSQHGQSPEMQQAIDKSWWQMVYFNGEAMRELFDACLDKEQRLLEEAGLVKIHEIAARPLRQGQRCFRKGYPHFETKPAGEGIG